MAKLIYGLGAVLLVFGLFAINVGIFFLRRAYVGRERGSSLKGILSDNLRKSFRLGALALLIGVPLMVMAGQRL